MKSVQKWFLAVAFCLVLVGVPRATLGKPQTQSRHDESLAAEDEEANEDLIKDIKNIEVKCSSHEITIRIPTPHPQFNGMVYPQGLSKNSSCLREYESTQDFIEYTLPLRSCNTMTTASESEEEYFNTIVLEPHPKLVTGHGRGFHVRCKYRRQETTSSMPTVTMKIYKNGQEIMHQGNESISIGDPIQFQILVHANTSTPFLVTDCHVKDGLGWAEELLVNSYGCPVDSEILPPFTYSENKASVEFPAHKFPYSPTVYYSCSVKICKSSERDTCLPPVCQGSKNLRESSTKFKRDANNEEPATVQVYNGLWVNEPPERDEADQAAEVLREKQARGEVLCFKQRDFALAIAISGLILMIAVILLLFILCLRRRRAFKSLSETGSSSIYSGSGTNFTGNTRGGYTNTAYSHSSD